MATAKKAADAVADGLKAASAKLKGTKGSSRKNFKAETEKLDKAAKAKPKAAPKAGAAKKDTPAEDPSIPKPVGTVAGDNYKPTLADKAGKVGGEALRMLEALPVGGPAIKVGRAALALTKAKTASTAEKAGEVALRAGVPKKTAAAAAPKAKPKKYDTSNAEDARLASDRPKLPAPAAKGASTGTKVAAGLTAGTAVAAAALSGGGKGEAKAAEKTATGTANSSKLNADDVKTASKAMGTEGKTAPKKSSGGGKGGGSYPVYKKDSAQAADFRKAFASARKEGKSVFTWEGRKYNTKLKSK